MREGMAQLRYVVGRGRDSYVVFGGEFLVFGAGISISIWTFGEW